MTRLSLNRVPLYKSELWTTYHWETIYGTEGKKPVLLNKTGGRAEVQARLNKTGFWLRTLRTWGNKWYHMVVAPAVFFKIKQKIRLERFQWSFSSKTRAVYRVRSLFNSHWRGFASDWWLFMQFLGRIDFNV